MKQPQYPMGSVSCATMRPEDLIPAFLYELQTRRRHRTLKPEHRAMVREIEKASGKKGYYESEDSHYDLESLFDALDAYAAPYFYFGAHPGDGADYGYWLSEMWEESFDGLRVTDTSEIPANYRGEVIHVSDHGNVTLYLKTARKLTELWAVV